MTQELKSEKTASKVDGALANFKSDPLSTFANVTLVFLQDWRSGRITADDVCETLLTAAIARNIAVSP
jgi:hypothetical protein